MSDDNRASIIIDGEVSPLRKSMREAAEELKRFGREGESALKQMTGPLASLQKNFMLIAAVLGGGKFFQEAVEQASKFTEESIKLGKALGDSATNASTFISALEDIDVSQEEFVAAAQGMLKQLKSNEEGLQAMGLKTRDAAGQLRPLNELLVEGVEIVNGYKAGTDRALAGQVAFGKGFQVNGNLLKLNSETLKENAELQQRLGILVGQENVDAFEAYDSATDKANLTLKAVGVTIGNAVMPVLTTLTNWFNAIGPAAVLVIKGSLGGLVSIFWGLKMSAEAAWNMIALGIEKATIQALRFSDVAWNALKLDFKGAAAAWATGGEMLEEVTAKRLDNIAKSAEETREKLWNLFAEGTPAAAPESGGKSAAGLLDEPKEKKKKEPQSVMEYYEAALASEKAIAAERNALREYSKQQELDFWRTIQQNATMSEKDRIAVERKVAQLTVEVKREAARQAQELDAENTRSAEAQALARVDAEQAATDALAASEQITQQAALALEQQYEQKRYAIKRSALQDKLALYEADPELNPVEMARIKNQLLELEQQYQIKKNHLQGKFLQVQKLEMQKSMQIWTSLGQSFASLWDKGVAAMMNGTLKWRNAIKAIGTELTGWFINNVVGAMVKHWLGGELAKFAISQGWIGKELALRLGMIDKETAAQITGSDAVVGAKVTEATGVATANAVEAGTGAAASQAPIPIIGPILAIAAMAAIFSQVSSMGSKIRSASKGFSIPLGLNPLTQLHEEEMVLPADIANPLRASLAGGRGVNPVINLNFNSAYHDRAGIKKLFEDNYDGMTSALRRAARNFNNGRPRA